MSIALINPNLVVQRSDPFTTGIVYMPISLAYLAAALRQAGRSVQVIDAYAAAPRQRRQEGNFLFFGLTEEQILEQLLQQLDAVFVYAINLTNHLSTVAIVTAIKSAIPTVPLV